MSRPFFPAPHERAGNVLSQGDIVDAALAVADAEGLDALSMRRVAKELGVGTMTLYSYVDSKDDLLDLMGDQVMGEQLFAGGEVPEDWRTALIEIAHRLRATWLRHPWVATTLGSRPRLGPNGLKHFEESAAAVSRLDVDDATAFAIIAAVDEYAMGFTHRELASEEFRRNAGMTMDQWRRAMTPYLQGFADSGDYPNIFRFLSSEADIGVQDERRFELGLRWLLDGIEASLPRRPRKRKRS